MVAHAKVCALQAARNMRESFLLDDSRLMTDDYEGDTCGFGTG